MNRVENKKQHDTYPLPPLIPPVFLLPPASVLSGPASAQLLPIFVKKRDHRKTRTVTENVPVAPPPPRLQEESGNDLSSSAMLPGTAASSAVSPVGAYSTVNEIFRKKSEKKKRQEDEQKEQKTHPLFPRLELLCRY